MQRFDMAVDPVFWARIVDTNRQGWHGGELGVRRMLRLAEKPYDCYIFLGIPPKNLTHEMQYKVLKPVVDGRAGIVCVGVRDKQIFKPVRKLKEPPYFIARTDPVGAYRVGKGRGVLLPPIPTIEYDVGWQFDYEAWQERFGRAIIWAAGREPQAEPRVRMRAVASDGHAAQYSIDVDWKNPAKRQVEIEVNLRRRDGVVTPIAKSTTREPAGRISRELPRLRRIRYRVEVIVRSRKGVESWAAVPMDVRDFFEDVPRRRMEAVKLERAWGEIGEKIRGTVALDYLSPQERLVVRVRDRRDRIVMEKKLPADEERFEFPIEPWLPMLVRVEAAIVDDAGEVASGHAWFNVVKRHRGQFNFLIWDTPRGPLAPYAEESLARLGCTVQLRGGTPPRYVAAHDIAWVPYTTRILESHTKKGVMKPFCWNDEAKVAAHVQKLAEKYKHARQHGVFVYSLGDENHVRGSCLSPHCLKAYRHYLAKTYGKIEALNASWGSNYKSFDQVQLLKPDDNQAMEARRLKNYPRWYDRQAFRSHNYVQFCKKFAEAYCRIDPKSRTGFEGAGRFGRGDDIDLFARELGFWSPYPGTADEVLRSIAPRDFPRANWMGYVKTATPLIAKYWRMITRGCDSVWWWRWDCIGRFHGFLAPHLGPWPATRELVEETKLVRDGLGTLLLHSEMLDSGIAMLFSHPSCYAGQLEGSYGGVEQNHIAWHKAIRELGLQFRYVTDRMLRRGEFDAKRYKVLILSRAEALGPKEAALIEAFARNGGTVIADVRPGIYDGHCKPLAAGALDKLFGIRRTGRGEAIKDYGRQWLIAHQGGALGRGKTTAADPGIELAGGKAHGKCGGSPVLIRNKVGKGQAVLLNFAMASYPKLDAKDVSEAPADLLGALLQSAGVKPTIRTRTALRRTRNLETVRWRDGGLQIVALFRHTGEDEKVLVELAKPRWVYDLRHRKTHAGARAFSTRILGSRPTFLVLAPKSLAGVRASLAHDAVARGKRATLRLEVPAAAGLHAVRLRATTPDGKPAEWLHQVVIVGRDPKEITLPIAFNDPEGKWEIRATDLFTEQTERLKLVVKEP